MTTYNAPVDEMMFLFDHLRDDKKYNEIEKFKEINSELVKDILEQAAKINKEIIHPLAKIGDDSPVYMKTGLLDHLLDIRRLIEILYLMAGPHFLAILNMAVKECQKP